MMKLNILNMESFLQAVNRCIDPVNLVCSDGKARNINKSDELQNALLREYSDNDQSLRLSVEVPNPNDYFKLVSYYMGDC
ncbi:hypothetical protein [Butyricicoccus sp.]|uniref:hypothetical protein n=1 Tax=Butyricicoccus sp. TaxID=2049021 RepID=UPI003F140BD9